MKTLRILAITAFVLGSQLAFGQRWVPETICATDTLVVEPLRSMKEAPDKVSSEVKYPYRIVQCRTRSEVGFRLDFAVSGYRYKDETAEWIGQHGSPAFGFILVYDKINAGMRFKPWTISPLKELSPSGETVPVTARMNVIKMDYVAGYSFDFEKRFSVEPYIGYNRSSFNVINETELDQKFNIRKTGGLIVGTTLNKYFPMNNYNYISVFATVAYGFVDYKIVHPALGNNYFEWSVGIAVKTYATKFFNKKVD